jgi:tRNA threonylcarbamoyladenosine biosynthesis protein TsaB
MLLIGIDTSGKQGSLCLALSPDGSPENLKSKEVQIVEQVALEGGTFSAQLIPQLAEALSRHRFSKAEIGAFAVASGPGSFTGLRVGLAAVKGLAEALQKPIVPVSLLEAVALASAGTAVWSALDAGRGEVYLAAYDNGELSSSGEMLVSREELVNVVGGGWVVTPHETVAEILRTSGTKVEVIPHPGSVGVARLGWAKLKAGNSVTPDSLEANYIRRSDAEIFSKPAVRTIQ